jgi:hypothetical protein
MPFAYRKDPGKIWACNPTLGHGGGAAGRNPARPAALPAGEGVRLVQKLTYDPLVAEVGA